MKSIRRAHIVVVADSDQGLVLAVRLRQTDVARVTSVADIAAARWLCQSGCADACIVALEGAVPDAAPVSEKDAPGRYTRVPSLMVVPAVTSHTRKLALRCGYIAAVPGSIRPRALYRRLGAVLQKRRAVRKHHQPGRMRVPVFGMPRHVLDGKPTLH